MSAGEFEKEFDRTGVVQAKSWVFTMVVMSVLFIPILNVYRFLLFFVTLKLMH